MQKHIGQASELGADGPDSPAGHGDEAAVFCVCVYVELLLCNGGERASRGTSQQHMGSVLPPQLFFGTRIMT